MGHPDRSTCAEEGCERDAIGAYYCRAHLTWDKDKLLAELAAAKKRIELLEHLHDKCVACGGSFGVEVPAPVCDGCERDVTTEKHDAWIEKTADLSEGEVAATKVARGKDPKKHGGDGECG